MNGRISSSAELVIVIIVLMIALMVKTVLDALISLITAPMFKMKCSHISLFGLMFTNQDGRWSVSLGKPSLICQSNVIIDKNKSDFTDCDKMSKRFSVLCVILMLIISAAAVLLNFPSIQRFIGHDASLTDIMLTAFSAGLLFHSLVSAGITMYTYMVMMKRLGGYVQFLVNRLRAGDSLLMMNLRPVYELGFENPTNVEKMMYYNVYLLYLLSLERVDEMRQPTYEMTDYLLDRDFIVQETLNYYWLIFYYSRFEINPPIADKFVERIWPVISADKDSNGKRVLAYYYYGIKGDSQTARKCVDEGLAALETFTCAQAERELERKLLLELDKILTYDSLSKQNRN